MSGEEKRGEEKRGEEKRREGTDCKTVPEH
jgi:hypothetical protein